MSSFPATCIVRCPSIGSEKTGVISRNDAGPRSVEAPAGGRTTDTWGYENQTTLVQLPGGARVTMAYNADNRRVWKDT
jgi:hypothetical protein